MFSRGEIKKKIHLFYLIYNLFISNNETFHNINHKKNLKYSWNL